MIVQKLATRWREVKERGDRWKPDDARGREGIREGRGIGAVPCVPLAILVSLRRAWALVSERDPGLSGGESMSKQQQHDLHRFEISL